MFLLKYLRVNIKSKMEKSTKKLKISYEISKDEDKKTNNFSKLDLLKKIKEKTLIKKQLLKNDKDKSLNEEDQKDDKLPKNFDKIWKSIKIMRNKEEAPVDTMGVSCSSTSKDPALYKFQTLVSLMLSSQTKDTVTFAIMKKLIDYGLTVENIIKTPIERITEMIYGVSFHNNKANNIKEVLIK